MIDTCDGSGVAHGTCHPLIACKEVRRVQQVQRVQRGVVRRIKIWKRHEVLIALRAHRHFERSREIFIAERSSSHMRQHQDIVFPRRIHTDSRNAVKDPSATLGMTIRENGRSHIPFHSFT